MSATVTVFAWIGLALGLVILVVVLDLFNRVLRPLRETERYVNDILDAGLGIARNVDGIDEAVRTRELATAVPPLAVSYLERLQGTP